MPIEIFRPIIVANLIFSAAVHDRMPVILEPEDYDRWLDAGTPIEELRAMLRPLPAERMQAEAVSRAVNSVKNDNEDCIAPIGEPPLAVEPDSSEKSGRGPLHPSRARLSVSVSISSRLAAMLLIQSGPINAPRTASRRGNVVRVMHQRLTPCGGPRPAQQR